MTPPILTESEGAVSASSKPRRVSAPEAIVLDKPKPPMQWRRMAFHVLSIGAAAYLSAAIEDQLVRYWLIIIALVLGTVYEVLRMFFGGWLTGLFTFLQGREEEKLTRTASMDFLVAMSVVACVFSPRISAAAFLTAALADPMARAFGISFGTVRWSQSRKTIEGSVGCFAVSLGVVMCTMPNLHWGLGFLAATVATIAELAPQRVYKTWFGNLVTPSDNFYIPICTAAVLWIAQ